MKRNISYSSHKKITDCFWLLITTVLVVSVQCKNTAEKNLIRRSDSLPATTPWNLEQLSQPPEFEWAGNGKIRSLYYKNEPFNGTPTRVFAYYATPGTLSGDPAKDKSLPAIVLVHGGGGTAFPEWVELWANRGYAAIAMDLAGCGPGRERLPDGGPGQGHDMKFHTIDQPVTQQWSYHAVANVIRAHSLIRSFPEVNAERTGLTGISWGGYLTCIVAGLDNRFKAAVPVYGCGFLYENSVWLEEFAKMTADEETRWIQLWDPSQYAGSTTIPVLFVNGGKDFAYPPDSYAKTYHLVRSEKNISFVPDLPHGHIFDRPEAVEIFIEHHLKKGIPLPEIINLDTDDKNITGRVDSKTEWTSAEFHYTSDSLQGDPEKRKWYTQPTTIKGKKIATSLPPETTTICFFTITDERNATISSKLIFPKNIQSQ
mgnify:CR=1 FL=1|jgi:cephalosporin-C deacetylase-like acetyl esterase